MVPVSALQRFLQRLSVAPRCGKRSLIWAMVGGLMTVTVLVLGLWTGDVAWSTASGPPQLVPAILNSNPIHVLYVTRSQDRVLVRCYPGFQPTLAPINQEGLLTCTATDADSAGGHNGG